MNVIAEKIKVCKTAHRNMYVLSHLKAERGASYSKSSRVCRCGFQKTWCIGLGFLKKKNMIYDWWRIFTVCN